MRALPWVLLGALIAWTAADAIRPDPSVERARIAQDSLRTLAPLVDSLKAAAEAQGAVLEATTDTVRVVVTRERVVQVAVIDTLYALADSVETVFLDSLIASEAREDVAQDLLLAETLAWGQRWYDVAQAQALQIEQLRVRGDAWEAAARAGQKSKWVERGGFVLTIACVAWC